MPLYNLFWCDMTEESEVVVRTIYIELEAKRIKVEPEYNSVLVRLDGLMVDDLMDELTNRLSLKEIAKYYDEEEIKELCDENS